MIVFPPSRGILFFSVLYNLKDGPSQEELIEKIELEFDRGRTEEAPTETMIKYYQKEMESSSLGRFFWFSGNLFSRDKLVDAKRWAQKIEIENSKMLTNGGRTVNLDPGMILLEHFVLITSKPYAHRPWIGDNYYCELTYMTSNEKYVPFPWTYPDYASQEVIALFEGLRKELKKQIRMQKNTDNTLSKS